MGACIFLMHATGTHYFKSVFNTKVVNNTIKKMNERIIKLNPASHILCLFLWCDAHKMTVGQQTLSSLTASKTNKLHVGNLRQYRCAALVSITYYKYYRCVALLHFFFVIDVDSCGNNLFVIICVFLSLI